MHGTFPGISLHSAWRIIPVSKWLVSPIYKPFKPLITIDQPYLGDLLTMVINHLLNEMILQVVGNILPGRSTLELRACPAPMGEGVYHAPGYSEGADEDRGMSATHSSAFLRVVSFFIGE